ncbi:MAG: LCP family protein [Roseburia sp.]|nr:LCP family protein [Roseburia sp.]MCM1202051.1 LCP family protein [Bacteroides fragilis]
MKAGKRNGNQYGKRAVTLAGILLCTVGFLAGGILIFGISGKYNLRTQAVSYAVGMEKAVQAEAAPSDEAAEWQEGWVRYKGKTYCYNSGILTFLFMGIDRKTDADSSEEKTGGGQADALFLLILDTKDEMVRLLPINRSTMTQVTMYGEDGIGRNTVEAQICVQYGFGDGGRESCEYQIEAVRRLLYEIPVNGYIAVDMDVIPAVTDAVGGIDLTVLEDIRNEKKELILREGENVRLDGEQAYWYLRARDLNKELSADARLGRQRQFLAGFIDKIKEIAGRDLSAPVKIFQEISGRAVTDITADEVVYLTAAARGYHFDADQIYTIPGTSISGEENEDSEFDEFHVDEDGLFELILELFYEVAE